MHVALDGPIISHVVLRVAPGRLAELVPLVDDFVRNLPPLCLERRVWSLVADPHTYCLVERWADVASLTLHRRSEAHGALLSRIAAVGAVVEDGVLGPIAARDAEPPALTQLVAHDLKNPLATISALVGVVEERISGTPSLATEAEDLRVVRAECGRVSRMLGDLLVLSRIERKRLHPQRIPLRVRDLVEDVARAVASRADALGAEVVVDSDATIARIDCDLVRRLLDNLVESALRQVGKGDRIQLAARAEEPERLRISVRHTGRDIPARVHSRLFEPEGGTGLGLYVCRLVAEAHAGSISLVARAGWSVSFEVILPLGAIPRSVP